MEQNLEKRKIEKYTKVLSLILVFSFVVLLINNYTDHGRSLQIQKPALVGVVLQKNGEIQTSVFENTNFSELSSGEEIYSSSKLVLMDENASAVVSIGHTDWMKISSFAKVRYTKCHSSLCVVHKSGRLLASLKSSAKVQKILLGEYKIGVVSQLPAIFEVIYPKDQSYWEVKVLQGEISITDPFRYRKIKAGDLMKEGDEPIPVTQFASDNLAVEVEQIRKIVGDI